MKPTSVMFHNFPATLQKVLFDEIGITATGRITGRVRKKISWDDVKEVHVFQPLSAMMASESLLASAQVDRLAGAGGKKRCGDILLKYEESGRSGRFDFRCAATYDLRGDPDFAEPCPRSFLMGALLKIIEDHVPPSVIRYHDGFLDTFLR